LVVAVALLHPLFLVAAALLSEAIGPPLLAVLKLVLVGEVVAATVGHPIVTFVAVLSKLYVIAIEFFLDELLRVAQFWKLDFLLLYYERRNIPFPFLIIPLCLFFNFINLIISHQEAHNLIEEIEFFGLLSDSIQQLLILLCIFIMDILELIHRILEFLF